MGGNRAVVNIYIYIYIYIYFFESLVEWHFYSIVPSPTFHCCHVNPWIPRTRGGKRLRRFRPIRLDTGTWVVVETS